MPRITMKIIESVMDSMERMDIKTLGRTKKRLFASQPEMVMALSAIGAIGASKDDIDNLHAVLMVALLAMEQTGLPWPRITVKMMTQGYDRMAGLIQEGGKYPLAESLAFRTRWMHDHDENILMDCVFRTVVSYGYSGDPDGQTSFDVMTMNIAEAIAIAARTLPRPS